ncbi:hypothetical protein [Methylocaldum sp.]|nr:hypothetical protein [Methylocaldum sp.]HYE36143.1 hypothetical protein [Methylocaldum sp.]
MLFFPGFAYRATSTAPVEGEHWVEVTTGRFKEHAACGLQEEAGLAEVP